MACFTFVPQGTPSATLSHLSGELALPPSLTATRTPYPAFPVYANKIMQRSDIAALQQTQGSHRMRETTPGNVSPK